MKGRANYLCLHRLDRLERGRAGAARSSDVFLPMIREWSGRTETGDRAELEDLPGRSAVLERSVAPRPKPVSAPSARGTTTASSRACVSAPRHPTSSIVNHHLLCADAAVRQNAYGEVIPACAHAIVDEAHQLEDVATQYFGFSISNYRLEDLARDVERFAASRAGRAPEAIATRSRKAVACLRDHARAFFCELAPRTPCDGPRQVKSACARPTRPSRTCARPLQTWRARSISSESTLALSQERRRVRRRRRGGDRPRIRRPSLDAPREVRDELRFLLRAGDPDYVYFVEFRGRGIFLRAAPIDVSAIVRELLLDRMRATVLTSATLTVDGTFDYIRDRLGISDGRRDRSCRRNSTSRGRRSCTCRRRMPDPRSPEFAMAAGQQVIEILKRTRGRAFVLFTSYAALRAVQAIAEMALDYPILVQGTAPRTELLQTVSRDAARRAVRHLELLAGVDVVGEALSCVIIDKLPFALAGRSGDQRPGSTRSAHAGGEPFGGYQVPLAILALQQGLGRLDPAPADRGVLAVPRSAVTHQGIRPAVHRVAAARAGRA